MSSDEDSDVDPSDVPSEFLKHRDPNAPMVQISNDVSQAYIAKKSMTPIQTKGRTLQGSVGFSVGDGLDGNLSQGDDGKYDDDPFAGADMAQPYAEESVVLDSEISELAQWQAERRQYLMDKRNVARREKEKVMETAKSDIEKFYTDRQERMIQIQVQNKKDAENYLQEMTDLMEHGAPWEKVSRLLDLKPRQGELPGVSSVARMRALLIQLKNQKIKS